MNAQTVRQASLWLILLTILFIALFPLVRDVAISPAQANWIMSLLYLSLCLIHLRKYNWEDEDLPKRANSILADKGSLGISTILVFAFVLILNHSGLSVIRIFLVLLCSLSFCYASLIFLNRKTSMVLFWINFYLFSGVFVLIQFPGVKIDLLSGYNPFAGLFLTLLA